MGSTSERARPRKIVPRKVATDGGSRPRKRKASPDSWTREPSDPVGGATIDVNVRASVAQNLGALRGHGLIQT